MPGRQAQLAQDDVSRLRFPFDSPQAAALVSAIAIVVNELADAAPGFVWRYPSHDGGHDDGGGPLFINVSVWQTYQQLHEFTYRSRHGAIVRRRARWFEDVEGPKTALWWVPAGHRPTPDEALARLRHLRQHGPTPQAFGVRRRPMRAVAPRDAPFTSERPRPRPAEAPWASH